jgi:hypothetical protein
MNTQEGETNVEFAHTIEEALEPLASKDPKAIKAFLTTIEQHPLSRLPIWGIATLYLCDPNQYPEVNNVPQVKKLREKGLTEEEKRHFLNLAAIAAIADLDSYGSEIEFSLTQSSTDEGLGIKDANLSIIEREIADLTKFRQALSLKKGAGPSAGEAPGKPSV